MKPIILFQTFLLLVPILIFSQQDVHDNQMKWLDGWTNFSPNKTFYPEAQEQLPSIIDTDLYLPNTTTYLLSGNVYVTNGATLTIQEGTIIRCDSNISTSLIITKDANFIARGLQAQPIVFTSDKESKSKKSGDWGGIVIIGSGHSNAPSGINNVEGDYLPQYSSYGGNDTIETSIIMTYVRIEYAGQKINSSKELNGLSLYTVNASSIINNIMISYSADDSFEFFGGTSKPYNLVSYKAKDDDFDFTLGYKGELYNILAIRHPYISDISGSYALEVDGYEKKSGMSSKESLSSVSVKNATLISLSDKNNYQHTLAAISSKNLANINITDSKISGFANVVKFDKSYHSYADLEQHFSLENSVFNVHNGTVMVTYEPKTSPHQLLKYNMFTTYFKSAEEFLTNPLHNTNPKFTLKESTDDYTVMQ
ncbi:hypothetical protein GCM10022393_19980 [Aquimarina addita]|uniref:T9SS C-terminal target domain-containing protein n=1 Tax=Aquimarina addita TaxID=870485 RepID=A0ABP6UI74_9FLAO